MLDATIFWYRKTSFSRGVQTWPNEGSTFVIMTNRSIKSILVSICISNSPFSMLILTTYYFATCRVAKPSQFIVWNCPSWLAKSTSPPFHCNALFICFLIFLVNTIVIFHKQKWFTLTIKIFMFFFDFEQRTNCKNNETFGRNNTHFFNEDK